ncbi:MAG: glycosyltransferase family 4 protein [Promethearchaeota archaeon]
MLKINFLSDFLQFQRFIGINGALVATLAQVKVMQNYVKITINSYEKYYDILHSHGCFPYTFRMVKRGIKLKKPIVISAHQTHHDIYNSFLFSKQLSLSFKQYIRRYYKVADVIICPTENSRKIVQNELRIKKPIKLISNGVDISKFQHSTMKRTQFRKKYDLNRPTVLSVGMPTRRKGFFDFIQISKYLIDLSFLWVGHRAFPLIQPNYIINGNNLIMPGFVNDIISAYSGGDIFCFPSYYEGEGIVVFEAMSCGLPVIIRDLPVYEGRFIDGKNCLKANNNNEFVEKIEYLIDNPSERKRIADYGLKTAKEFDINKTAKNLYKVYLELI